MPPTSQDDRRITEERRALARVTYGSLTDEALANRLILIAEQPKTFLSAEKTALLYVAADRLGQA